MEKDEIPLSFRIGDCNNRKRIWESHLSQGCRFDSPSEWSNSLVPQKSRFRWNGCPWFSGWWAGSPAVEVFKASFSYSLNPIEKVGKRDWHFTGEPIKIILNLEWRRDWGGDVGKKDLTKDDAIALQILEMLKGMRYGSITLVVQDGKVIQLEKSEKVRLSWTVSLTGKPEAVSP